MWNAAVTLFDDENEEALIERFVELSAAWPNEDPISICRFIFETMKDPELRAGQAAIVWSNSLAIKERIRQLRLNGKPDAETVTKENLQAKILAATEDDGLSHHDKKAKIEGYMAYAQLNGWVVKAIEKKTENLNPRFPQVIAHIYPDD